MDARDYRKQFGLRVQRQRHDRGLSQRDLAAMVGTNQPYLWKIENGEVNVGIDLICRLGEALDVSIGKLFDD